MTRSGWGRALKVHYLFSKDVVIPLEMVIVRQEPFSMKNVTLNAANKCVISQCYYCTSEATLIRLNMLDQRKVGP